MSEFETNHPSDERLSFSVIFHEKEEQTGESGYSLGTPEIPAYYEITGVVWSDGQQTVDITNFLTDYADNLFPKWEEELLEQNPTGE